MQINAAIKKLRETMGESQQAFATRLGISIRGLVNYEDNRVPGLIVLSQLQQLAQQDGIAEGIRHAIQDAYSEALAKSPPRTVSYSIAGDKNIKGLIFETLNSPEEVAYASAFWRALDALRTGSDAARKVLTKLFDSAAPFFADGEVDAMKQSGIAPPREKK